MPLKPLTRTVSQQSTVPAGGQSVTQGSTSTPNNEQSWRTAREALKTGFEAAVIVVEGLEIPSAKEAFRGVILILERIATVEENADSETIRTFQICVDDLRKGVLEPLEQVKEEYIPVSLKTSVENLAEELVTLMQPWKDRSQRKSFKLVPRSVTTKKDSADLADLALIIRAAIHKFMAIAGINQLLELAKMARGMDKLEVKKNGKQQQSAPGLGHKVARERLLRSAYIERLGPVAEASYDHYERRDIAPCLNNTRVDILDKIKAWVKNTKDDQPRIFWLNGMAGVGKSSISRSIAEWAKEEKILGANFFFSRDVSNLQNSTLLFPTLAYQLADFDEQFKHKLADVLSRTPDVPSGSSEFAEQFEQLIQRPWSLDARTNTVLVVLDALDECAEEEKVMEFLDVLLKRPKSTPGKFLIFLASRPEALIRKAFRAAKRGIEYTDAVLHETRDSVVEQDVKNFLRHHLANTGLPNVAYDDISSLAKDCGHIFLYAKETIRFILDPHGGDPPEQLRRLLKHPLPNPSPYMALDSSYLRVLEGAISKTSGVYDLELIQQTITTIVTLRTPLPRDVLAKLTGLREDEILRALEHLYSIIIVPSPDADNTSPRPLHWSFRDFITDRERCTDVRFLVESEREEERICLRCFEIMASDLERTMSNINQGPQHFGNQYHHQPTIDELFTPLLQYACKFWAAHLLQTRQGSFVVLDVHLREFVQHRYRRWFDAMSWLSQVGKLDTGAAKPSAIAVRVIKWMEAHDLNRETSELLRYNVSSGRADV